MKIFKQMFIVAMFFVCLPAQAMQKLLEAKTQHAEAQHDVEVGADGGAVMALEPSKKALLLESLNNPEFLKEYRSEVIRKINSFDGGDAQWPERRAVIREAVERGVHPNTISYGWKYFPLYEAVSHRDEKFTKYLLMHLAHATQLYGKESLLFHTTSKNIVELLLQYGAPVNVQNDDPLGESFLYHISRDEDLGADFIEVSKKYGIDPLMNGKHGNSPLEGVFCYGRMGWVRRGRAALGLEKAKMLVELGVSLDSPMVREYVGFTLVQAIHVKMKELLEEFKGKQDSEVFVFYKNLLETVKSAALTRKQVISDDMGEQIPLPVKAIVLGYCEKEDFSQTEEEINELHKQLKDRQRKKERQQMNADLRPWFQVGAPERDSLFGER